VEPDAYKDKVNTSRSTSPSASSLPVSLCAVLDHLFRGQMRGFSPFPTSASARSAWAVLVLSSASSFSASGARCSTCSSASAEASGARRARLIRSLAGTLLVFLFAYLNLGRWPRALHAQSRWAGLPSGGAGGYRAGDRRSIGIAASAAVAGRIAVLGFGWWSISPPMHDRAVLLIPTGFLLLISGVALLMTVTGSVQNAIIGPGAALAAWC